MKWLFVVVLVFVVCITFPRQPVFLGELVIEKQGVIPGERDSHQGIPLSALCCVVWAEGVEPRRRRRRPYRNPLRQWRKLMRRLAREQRRAARRAQRQVQSVEIAAVPIKEQAVVAVKVEEKAIDRKKPGRPSSVATNHIFCPTEGCRGYGQLRSPS